MIPDTLSKFNFYLLNKKFKKIRYEIILFDTDKKYYILAAAGGEGHYRYNKKYDVYLKLKLIKCR